MRPVQAIENNLYAYPIFHAWSRAETYDGPDLLWAITNIHKPLFNRLGRANLDENAADGAIEAAVERGRARHVPLLWWLGPSSQPSNLGERLRAHGFTHTRDLFGMVATLEPIALPDSPRIERVRDREMLHVWNDVPQLGEDRYAFYAERFDDALRHYIGYLDDVPVAIASLFLGGGAAGIYNIYTKPELRNRGIGTALTIAAMNDARALGYREAVLLANSKSAPLYARLGFVEHCRVGNYLWMPG